ncbi:hypothetical protein G9394_03415 [Proteus vulgaris]|nr:hypothetical protein G9394_03415 [Proteus vulgaris]
MIELQKQFQPKARNICSCCGEDVGVSKLVVAGNVNICFECADLLKQLADKKRKDVAFRQVRELGDFLKSIEGGTSMYEIAEKIYDAGYRKVE